MKTLLVAITVLFVVVSPGLADVPELDSEPDGAALYRQNCARCHGKLETTRIPDRRPARIASAINTLGSMAGLKHLSAGQIAEIAKALIRDPAVSSR